MSQLRFRISKSFFFEDTNDGCYRDIIAALLQNQWIRFKSNKIIKNFNNLYPPKDIPLLVWTIMEKDIDFDAIEPQQICNHYSNITCLTTKLGLCELLRDTKWICQNDTLISPRSYNLGDSNQRDEFIDDFKIHAVLNIIKYYFHSFLNYILNHCKHDQIYLKYQYQQLQSFDFIFLYDENYIHDCMIVLQSLLDNHLYGKWCDSDENRINMTATNSKSNRKSNQSMNMNHSSSATFSSGSIPAVNTSGKRTDTTKDNNHGLYYGLQSYQWDSILDISYKISAECHEKSLTSLSLPLLHQSLSLLHYYDTHHHIPIVPLSKYYRIIHLLIACFNLSQYQFSLASYQNLWIVKAPEARRGVGMRICYKLEDILESEKRLSSRIVQKYVETPLLAPLDKNILRLRSKRNSVKSHSYGHDSVEIVMKLMTTISSRNYAKFDMRIWVMITSFQPLQAFIYNHIYGRRCSSSYTMNMQSLHDENIHLTNYSIQKKNLNQKSSTTTMNDGYRTVSEDDLLLCK
jgi:hypothetical protein